MEEFVSDIEIDFEEKVVYIYEATFSGLMQDLEVIRYKIYQEGDDPEDYVILGGEEWVSLEDNPKSNQEREIYAQGFASAVLNNYIATQYLKYYELNKN